MTIYEVVNSSDIVTFLADDDRVALMANILVGEGLYGLKKGTEDEPPEAFEILRFRRDALDVIERYLGVPLVVFMPHYETEVINALKSFAYFSREQRRMYDDAIECITDQKLREDFRRKQEDLNRTSTNKIVQKAWMLADMLEKQHKKVQ
jgi:hypothetical protein